MLQRSSWRSSAKLLNAAAAMKRNSHSLVCIQQGDLAAILKAVQKTSRGGAECWEPAGEEIATAIFAAVSAIAEINGNLSTGRSPAGTHSLTPILGATTAEDVNMLYAAG